MKITEERDNGTTQDSENTMEENEIPNETTIKALEEKDEDLFSAESAEQMITDCLDGDESWKNVNQNRKV